MKVKLNTKNITASDNEEKEVLDIWDGEVLDLPEEIVEKTKNYKGEKEVGILEIEPVFSKYELISISEFSKNPSKYIKLLKEKKLAKIALLKNNKIQAIIQDYN